MVAEINLCASTTSMGLRWHLVCENCGKGHDLDNVSKVLGMSGTRKVVAKWRLIPAIVRSQPGYQTAVAFNDLCGFDWMCPPTLLPPPGPHGRNCICCWDLPRNGVIRADWYPVQCPV